MIVNISANSIDFYIGNKVLIIDVRNRNKYENGHIKGAVNMPLENLEEANLNIPYDVEIVIYCDRGGKSLQAANVLSKRGYKVLNVVGGLKEYKGKNIVK